MHNVQSRLLRKKRSADGERSDPREPRAPTTNRYNNCIVHSMYSMFGSK